MQANRGVQVGGSGDGSTGEGNQVISSPDVLGATPILVLL